MRRCAYSDKELAAFVDGEAGRLAGPIAQHLETCASCRAEVENQRAVGEALRGRIDAALGEVDPLLALRQIRARIETNEHGLGARLRAFAEDLWLLHRRALAGVAVAAGLGALSAPAVLWWASSVATPMGGPRVASVVVESVEVGGRSTAVVLRESDSTTTLIWVAPREDREDDATH